ARNSRLESFFFFCYSLLSWFSLNKHSRDFILAISAAPTSPRISNGGFFMTRSDSFVIRLGPASVLESLNRSLQFFVTLLSAIREPCTREGTGSGFGSRPGGQRPCPPSYAPRRWW